MGKQFPINLCQFLCGSEDEKCSTTKSRYDGLFSNIQDVFRVRSLGYKIRKRHAIRGVENAMRSIRILRWKIHRDDATILKSMRFGKTIHPRYNNVDSVALQLHRISNHVHLIGQSMIHNPQYTKYYYIENT